MVRVATSVVATLTVVAMDGVNVHNPTQTLPSITYTSVYRVIQVGWLHGLLRRNKEAPDNCPLTLTLMGAIVRGGGNVRGKLSWGRMSGAKCPGANCLEGECPDSA